MSIPALTNIIIDGPENADYTFVFAHGAGAGMEHEFMQGFAEQLAACDIKVIRFEFPYMQKRRIDGKKYPPNRQPQLVDAYKELLSELSIQNNLIIGGKSMGGRIASLVAAEEADKFNIKALICLGFPFYAPKKNRLPEESRGQHLYQIKTPSLILQGQRDNFATDIELQAMPLSEHVNSYILPDGDHSFKPRVKSGFTLEQNIQTAVSQIQHFIKTL